VGENRFEKAENIISNVYYTKKSGKLLKINGAALLVCTLKSFQRPNSKIIFNTCIDDIAHGRDFERPRRF
jgi:hypothetical protein